MRLTDGVTSKMLKNSTSLGFSQLPGEQVFKHAEVLGSKGGEDRDEEAGHHARCHYK